MSGVNDFLELKNELHAIGVEMRKHVTPDLKDRILKAIDRYDVLINGPKTASVPETTGPTSVLAKRAGYPDRCDVCLADSCTCFQHLSKPRLVKRPDSLIKIAFEEDWTPEDRIAWLKGAKLILTKRSSSKGHND